jgi:DNA-binding response OmpR family regulator
VAEEHVLAVVSERRRAAELSHLLRATGLAVTVADRGSAALLHLEAGATDLIVIDLALADMGGVELCHLLRVWVRAPILVIADEPGATAIAALDAGADDFVTWPLDPAVFGARVRVARRHAAALAAAVGDDLLVCGDLQVDVGAHLVRLGDVPVELQPRQFTLLATLMRNVGRLVPHAQLARVLWGVDRVDSDTERLRSAVSALRRHIGSGPQRPVIETAPTLGYRLVPPA